MKVKTLFLALLGCAVVIALVLGAYTVRAVFAQTATPTPAPGQPGWGKGFRGAGFGYSDQDLATALGISVDKLQAAYQSAGAEALKEAVSKGLLTQQQADQLSQRLNGRPFPGFGRFNASGIDYNALLAKALGISTDQLQAGYQKAFTTAVNAAVKSGRLTQAQADGMLGRYALANNSKFQSSLQAAFVAAVNQAVKDGIITQAQADQILKSQSTSGARGFPFGGGKFFGGPGGPGGFGGFHGFGRRNGFNKGPNAKPTPTASPSGTGL